MSLVSCIFITFNPGHWCYNFRDHFVASVLVFPTNPKKPFWPFFYWQDNDEWFWSKKCSISFQEIFLWKKTGLENSFQFNPILTMDHLQQLFGLPIIVLFKHNMSQKPKVDLHWDLNLDHRTRQCISWPLNHQQGPRLSVICSFSIFSHDPKVFQFSSCLHGKWRELLLGFYPRPRIKNAWLRCL